MSSIGEKKTFFPVRLQSMNISQPTGMRAFIVIWLGQIVSLFGSAMTWFAFTLWVWQKTGHATALATVSFLSYLPGVLFMPVAGILVDRWPHKATLILSDFGTAAATLTVLALYLSNRLEIWHVYTLSLLAGLFTAFQYPAYMAATTALVPENKFANAQGMIGLAQSASGIFAPMIAAALLPFMGMDGIMKIDLITFLIAFSTLLWIKFPPHIKPKPDPEKQISLPLELSLGFRVIFSTPTLRALTILFIAANFFLAIGATLLAPTILSHTGNNELILAAILSAGAFGGIAGGGILSIWGGPKRRENGILIGGAAACLIGISLFGLARGVIVWTVASFFFSFFEPFVEGDNAAIWQSKVETGMQGRIFSARQLLTQIPYLLGVIGSGWLAEAGISKLTGTQNGIHLSMTLVFAGVFGAAIFLSGYFYSPIRAIDAPKGDA